MYVCTFIECTLSEVKELLILFIYLCVCYLISFKLVIASALVRKSHALFSVTQRLTTVTSRTDLDLLVIPKAVFVAVFVIPELLPDDDPIIFVR